jgi:hypothetical protein
MRSAFWRGVALLNESESNVGQGQAPTIRPSNRSALAEGISEVPKNAMLLKPVINDLTDQVVPIVI